MASASSHPRLTIILPTIGRPTLARALLSLRRQSWYGGDEVWLVADGESATAKSLWEQFGLPGRYITLPGPFRDWGHTPRNLLMHKVEPGRFIGALDDDDELDDNAVKTIHAATAARPDVPHIFRMDGVHGRPDGKTVVWDDPVIRLANVGTPMFYTPSGPGKTGKYESVYGGDHAFIRDTVALYPPGSLVWHEEIICHVRPA